MGLIKTATKTRESTPVNTKQSMMVKTKSGRTVKPTSKIRNTMVELKTSLSSNQHGSRKECLKEVNSVPFMAVPVTPPLIANKKFKLKKLTLSLPRTPLVSKLPCSQLSGHAIECSPPPDERPWERLVTIERTPPIPQREVRILNTTPPTSPNTQSKALSSPNILSMSLESILKEMDKAKAVEIILSNKDRLVTLNPPDPPIYNRLDSERKVQFINNSPGSLTEEEVNSFFSPLGERTSLDQVLQGDGLFGPESSNTQHEDSNSVVTRKRKVRFRLEEDEEQLTNYDTREDCHFKLNVSVNDSVIEKESPLVTTPPSEDRSSLEGTPPPLVIAPLEASPLPATASSPVIATPLETTPLPMSNSSSKTTPLTVEDEDMIDIYADDVDVFDSDIDDPPLSKLFKNTLLKAHRTKVPLLKAPLTKTTPVMQYRSMASHPNNGTTLILYLVCMSHNVSAYCVANVGVMNT